MNNKYIVIILVSVLSLCAVEYFIPIHRFIIAKKIEVVIKDKQIKPQADKSGKYLIFTDKEVFENVDETLFLKWDSSDVYGNLDIGKKYELKVTGFRVNYFSWYRNIISIKKEIK